MTNVILPRPLHLHRCAKGFRKQRRFKREIALRFAPETAAEQRDVDGHVILGDSEGLCGVIARAAGALHRRPDFGLVVFDIGDATGGSMLTCAR